MSKQGILMPLLPSHLMVIGARGTDEVLLAFASEVAMGLAG